MTINRKQTKLVKCKNINIGSDAPITIQSMTNTDTKDIESTVRQINELEKHGCEIVRVAVLDMECAKAIKEITSRINIPLVADIHFDYRLAIESINSGADKIRINPGNIGTEDRVRKVIEKAKERKIPVRIGVNSGSIDKKILNKFGKVTPEAMVESALQHIKLLESFDFYDIVLSLKASSVKLTYDCYRLISKLTDYPLHVGITEAGTVKSGKVKSAIGIGALLLNGIGDTIRVSLTGSPIEEVIYAKEILNSLEIRRFGINIISCPTCGRCKVDLVKIAERVENKIKDIDKPITVAIMGCAVNGPGEAREADIGIAGGDKKVLLFKKGEIIDTISEENAEERLLDEILKM